MKLPYLDVVVERSVHAFVTNNYGKPTFTGLYLSWDSSAPTTRKINLIKTLTHYKLMISSECKLEMKLKKITEIFLFDGDPE